VSLSRRFSTYRELVALAPEELGGALLMELRAVMEAAKTGLVWDGDRVVWALWLGAVNLDTILQSLEQQLDTPEWPKAVWSEVNMSALEAWLWLETTGLIMEQPIKNGRYIPTRRGWKLGSERDLANYRNSGILPVGLLHPWIASEVSSLFMHGHLDTAVFHAFREVEIALRRAVPGEPKRTGREVVRDAFNPTNGKLRNIKADVTDSERDGEFALFSGAIGCLKNPGSHSRVPLFREDAARLVLFASHLLSLVEERTIFMLHDGAEAPGK